MTHMLCHTLRHHTSFWVIPKHHWHHCASTTGLAPLLRTCRPRSIQTIQPVSRLMPSTPLCTYIKHVPSTSLTHSHVPLKCVLLTPSNMPLIRVQLMPSTPWGCWWHWWHALWNTDILRTSKLTPHTSLIYGGSTHISSIQSGLCVQLDFERLIVHFCQYKVFFLSLTFVFIIWICCVGWVTWLAWLLGNHARSINTECMLSTPSIVPLKCVRLMPSMPSPAPLTCPTQTHAINAIDTFTHAPQTCTVDALNALIMCPSNVRCNVDALDALIMCPLECALSMPLNACDRCHQCPRTHPPNAFNWIDAVNALMRPSNTCDRCRWQPHMQPLNTPTCTCIFLR